MSSTSDYTTKFAVRIRSLLITQHSFHQLLTYDNVSAKLGSLNDHPSTVWKQFSSKSAGSFGSESADYYTIYPIQIETSYFESYQSLTNNLYDRAKQIIYEHQ